MNIGPYVLANNLFAAPMAGVTDRPFRRLCKALGAGYAVSEMVSSRRELWGTLKTSRRANHDGEVAPIAVQIAGTDARMMAEAAAYNIDRGAPIIDINIGRPPQKNQRHFESLSPPGKIFPPRLFPALKENWGGPPV